MDHRETEARREGEQQKSEGEGRTSNAECRSAGAWMDRRESADREFKHGYAGWTGWAGWMGKQKIGKQNVEIGGEAGRVFKPLIRTN